MKHLLILFVTVLASTASLEWRRCDREATVVEEVNVTGCEVGDRCALQKGTSPSVNITFTPARDIESAKVKVYGVVWGVKVPFGLANPDACMDSGLVCPLKQGQNYLYNNSIPIKNYFPSIDFVIRWELRDNFNKVIYCILADAEIS